MSKPTIDINSFRIQVHGDSQEQRFADFLLSEVPAYEPFWQRFIVPLTFRVLDKKHPYVRPSIKVEYADYADASYAMMWHLTWAWQHSVDIFGTQKDNRVDRTKFLYGFVIHLRSFCEITERFAVLIDTLSAVRPFRSKFNDHNGYFDFHPTEIAVQNIVNMMHTFRLSVVNHRNAVLHKLPLYVISDRIPTSQAMRTSADKLGLTMLGKAVKEGVGYPMSSVGIDSWTKGRIADACRLGTSMWKLAAESCESSLTMERLISSGLDEDRSLTIEKFNAFLNRNANSTM